MPGWICRGSRSLPFDPALRRGPGIEVPCMESAELTESPRDTAVEAPAHAAGASTLAARDK